MMIERILNHVIFFTMRIRINRVYLFLQNVDNVRKYTIFYLMFELLRFVKSNPRQRYKDRYDSM
jgi:hypothetical protein